MPSPFFLIMKYLLAVRLKLNSICPMTDEIREALKGSLGDPNRDFKTEPLTQEEIQAIVETYIKEASRPGLDPQLREIYCNCIDFLKKHLVFH